MLPLLTTKGAFGSPPLKVGVLNVNPPKEQMILRMMVREKGGDLFIPECLLWLQDTIKHIANLNDWYIYVTVRSGIVTSQTDDHWHVDGFSMRVPHPPEKNFIWTDVVPTEFFVDDLRLPEDFDAHKHNIHQYFHDKINGRVPNFIAEEKTLYQIDPYVVHRRPPITAGMQRSFFRISLVPIEIEDDTCTPNPIMSPKQYNRQDIRDILVRYPLQPTLKLV